MNFATSGKFTAILCASTPTSREWARAHTEERLKGKEKEKEQGKAYQCIIDKVKQFQF